MQKYHASTNCIPKTIQRTIKYLNDPFKNIINLSKTKNKKKKKKHLHIMNLSIKQRFKFLSNTRKI